MITYEILVAILRDCGVVGGVAGVGVVAFEEFTEVNSVVFIVEFKIPITVAEIFDNTAILPLCSSDTDLKLIKRNKSNMYFTIKINMLAILLH